MCFEQLLSLLYSEEGRTAAVRTFRLGHSFCSENASLAPSDDLCELEIRTEYPRQLRKQRHPELILSAVKDVVKESVAICIS